MAGKVEFPPLKAAKIADISDSAGFNTLALEREMVAYNGGINLSHIKTLWRHDGKLQLKYVPCFKADELYEKGLLETAELYPSIDGPCSMIINSKEELEEVMSKCYQVSHHHYILGKRHNLKGLFPKDCCGTSSRSVAFSLMEHGFPNAAFGYSLKAGHGYVLLPFVTKDEGIEGCVITDPTYNQSDAVDPWVRNPVFIKLGSKWKDTTEWGDNDNMFPQYVLGLDVLKESPPRIDSLAYYWNIGSLYLGNAFSNPIDLKQL
ncbi:MAG: hypothetical protein JW727_06540 [Candidatus Aenigmarchaeota archaeon]|nr:hypothetical protein [Candidatus Aenigmarchaeota archaeon]